MQTGPDQEAFLEQVSYRHPEISFTVKIRGKVRKSFITSLTIEYQSRSSVTTILHLGNYVQELSLIVGVRGVA